MNYELVMFFFFSKTTKKKLDHLPLKLYAVRNYIIVLNTSKLCSYGMICDS